MRRIYFIRHARPDIPFGERWCVGSRTDFPLGTYGLIQASLLSFEPELKNLDTVFCSRLSRARETALSISPSPVMIPGLEEQDMGEWDGLSFAEIMKGWPELYAARENDPYVQREDILGQNDQFALEKLYENDDEEYLNEDNEDFLNKFLPEDSYNMKRSKTFVPKPAMLETPRLKLKDSDNDNFMSPFKLSIKSFGILPQKNQMPNKILLDFQKDIMDCKSCNDNEEEIFEEYLLFNADTEKTTPNPEDLLDLLNCRKKMIKFRNSINYSPCNEYENILNCDKIIENIQDETESHHGKKKSIWNKYIKEQINKEKNKNYEHNKRLFSEPFPNVEINFENFNEEDEKEDEKNEENEEDNLFILGVIERAAKERKTIKSAFVK